MKKFQLQSGVLICSDPCLEIGGVGMAEIENVKKGTWIAFVDKIDTGEIMELKIVHSEHESLQGIKWEELKNVQTDSGQFGFFDKPTYQNDIYAVNLPKERLSELRFESLDWFESVCYLTLSEEEWGVQPFGVASLSGFGKGLYTLFGGRNEIGEYVSFQVNYIYH